MQELKQSKIAIIGLGYVGLPLAIEFGKQYPTLGFDVNKQRINELNRGIDRTLEVEGADFQQARQLTFSCTPDDLKACNCFIVTVPTPVDKHRRPDLSPLLAASRTVGSTIKRGDTVIFESTVYPGATEEACIPVIEAISGLVFNSDFYAGYSPERINPGDKEHRVTTIMKVTSGSTEETAEYVDALYRSIISAGTHKASSIKVAEAAKVIENTQRDLNIALINELAVIFNKLEIDTMEVLEAAGTKWNFLPFRPGLVGGHCISVDPYYLTYKAQEIGYNPEIILAGRRINDSMGAYIAERVVKALTKKRIHVVGARILVMGLAFKENCPDLRNTRVIDVIKEFESYHANVEVYDPWVSPDEALNEYGVELIKEPRPDRYDATIIAVGHNQFKALGAEGIRQLGKPGSILFDVKHILPKDQVDERL